MARTDPRPHYGAGRRIAVNGYVDLWRPDHHLARSEGYVSEHRFVMWEAGLLTDPNDHVHHKNGDKADNRLENLEVISAAEHARLHWENNRSTHCPKGHEFTPENTAFNPSGWRYCKQCNRNKAAAHRRRKAEASV